MSPRSFPAHLLPLASLGGLHQIRAFSTHHSRALDIRMGPSRKHLKDEARRLRKAFQRGDGIRKVGMPDSALPDQPRRGVGDQQVRETQLPEHLGRITAQAAEMLRTLSRNTEPVEARNSHEHYSARGLNAQARHEATPVNDTESLVERFRREKKRETVAAEDSSAANRESEVLDLILENQKAAKQAANNKTVAALDRIRALMLRLQTSAEDELEDELEAEKPNKGPSEEEQPEDALSGQVAKPGPTIRMHGAMRLVNKRRAATLKGKSEMKLDLIDVKHEDLPLEDLRFAEEVMMTFSRINRRPLGAPIWTCMPLSSHPLQAEAWRRRLEARELTPRAHVEGAEKSESRSSSRPGRKRIELRRRVASDEVNRETAQRKAALSRRSAELAGSSPESTQNSRLMAAREAAPRLRKFQSRSLAPQAPGSLRPVPPPTPDLAQATAVDELPYDDAFGLDATHDQHPESETAPPEREQDTEPILAQEIAVVESPTPESSSTTHSHYSNRQLHNMRWNTMIQQQQQNQKARRERQAMKFLAMDERQKEGFAYDKAILVIDKLRKATLESSAKDKQAEIASAMDQMRRVQQFYASTLSPAQAVAWNDAFTALWEEDTMRRTRREEFSSWQQQFRDSQRQPRTTDNAQVDGTSVPSSFRSEAAFEASASTHFKSMSTRPMSTKAGAASVVPPSIPGLQTRRSMLHTSRTVSPNSPLDKQTSRPRQSSSQKESSPELTHISPSGSAHMVSITDKPSSARSATAVSRVIFSNPDTHRLVASNLLKKGDVLSVARIAGIMAAKATPQLIPLCHPIDLSHVSIELQLFDSRSTSNLSENQEEMGDLETSGGGECGVLIEARCECSGQTGVEMEALTAATVAGLTVYDMCKAVDKGMKLGMAMVVQKKGGKSGDWTVDKWRSLQGANQ